MNGLETLLASRASFVLAALAVSWIAVVFLALAVANLHFRLASLERRSPATEDPRKPYGHLLGRSLAEVLGSEVPPSTRLALVLASDCSSCDRILQSLGDSSPGVPLALLWRDGTPSPPPALPFGATVMEGDAETLRALGVRVTPFALAADGAGRIVRAAPIGSGSALRSFLDDTAEPGPATPNPSSSTLIQRPLKGAAP